MVFVNIITALYLIVILRNLRRIRRVKLKRSIRQFEDGLKELKKKILLNHSIILSKIPNKDTPFLAGLTWYLNIQQLKQDITFHNSLLDKHIQYYRKYGESRMIKQGARLSIEQIEELYINISDIIVTLR